MSTNTTEHFEHDIYINADRDAPVEIRCSTCDETIVKATPKLLFKCLRERLWQGGLIEYKGVLSLEEEI